jgi:thiol-disulfide isomerase/thioredoxin
MLRHLSFAIILIPLFIVSCTGAKKNDIDDFLISLKSSASITAGVRILDIKVRQKDYEFTVVVELEPEYQTGSKFSETLDNFRNLVKKEWTEFSGKPSSILVNILVKDNGQVVFLDSEGFGHDVVIILNTPPDIPSVINFSAPWCEKGKKTDEIMNEIVNSGVHQVHYETVDTDKETGLTDYLNIVEIPTLMFFDSLGNIVESLPGPITQEEIIQNLEKITK